MKKELLLCLGLLGLLLVAYPNQTNAQQQVIEFDSDDQQDPGDTDGPHLLLLETGDSGATSGGDGWARLWFRNSSDPDPLNRWSFLARPHAGAIDNGGVLTQPLVMAHQAEQRFGFGSDGTLRINKQFTLPNMDGADGQVMTTNGLGVVTWQTPTGGSASSTSLLEDADGDSSMSFLEGSTSNGTDTISMKIGTGGNSEEIFRCFNGGIDGFRKMVIATNSSPTSPQLRLTETGGADASRLFFTNEATGNDWILTGNAGSNLANVRFNANYNGSLRFSYVEADSTLRALNNITSFADSNNESFITFENNQTVSNQFRIVGDPSNTGSQNAFMHFDWKSNTLERDFMTFTADGNSMDPFIDFHQKTRNGTDSTAPADEILDEIFWDEDIPGTIVASRVKINNDDAGLVSLIGSTKVAESSTAQVLTGTFSRATTSNSTGVEYGIFAEADGNTPDSWGMFVNGNIWHTGTMMAPSDKRLKTNIKKAEGNVLDKLMNLEVKTYEYNNQLLKHMNFPKGEQLGFLAQDIQKVFPKVVQLNKMPTDSPDEIDENTEIVEILGVEYNRFIPILTSAIQEQQIEIEQLRKDNKEMKIELAELRKMIVAIKK